MTKTTTVRDALATVPRTQPVPLAGGVTITQIGIWGDRVVIQGNGVTHTVSKSAIDALPIVLA